MSYTISFLQPKDVEALGNLYLPWSDRKSTIEKWTRYLQEQSQSCRMACLIRQEAAIIGYGHLLFSSQYLPFRNQAIAEIQDLWVFKEYRRKGVATLLIAHLEQLARQQGYKQIGLGVGLYRDYGSAQRLYARLGYNPDGGGVTYKYKPINTGQSYPIDDDLIFWMIKQL